MNGVKPKVVVLMIGTKNMHADTAAEITQAETKMMAEIHRHLPDTKILILGIFARSKHVTNPPRAKIKQINTELKKFDDGKKTRFLVYFWNIDFDPQVQLARGKSTELILQRIKALNTALPIMLIGDFNAAAVRNSCYELFTAKDAW